MNLAAVIQQLRDHAPVFGGRVAGAADYAKGVAEQVWMALPAAYVVPEDEDPGQQTATGGGFNQDVTEAFGLIVVFDNSTATAAGDRRGQTVTHGYDAMRRAVFRALLNWRPPPSDGDVLRAAQGLYYTGGELVGYDRARLFYQWNFALDTLISDADGWQDTLPDLDGVDITVDGPADAPEVVASIDTTL